MTNPVNQGPARQPAPEPPDYRVPTVAAQVLAQPAGTGSFAKVVVGPNKPANYIQPMNSKND